MRVGYFVRFNHVMATNNGGILSRERGMVTSMSPNGRVATVVWADGELDTVSVRKLVRTEGKVGAIVGDKKKPLRDRGIKPVHAPAPKAPTPSLPVDRACWAIIDQYEVRGFTPEATPTRPDPGFMRFACPVKVVCVKATHWPDGTAPFKMSRSLKSLTVTFPNGEKKSMTPTGGREWLYSRFGGAMGKTLAGMLDVG